MNLIGLCILRPDFLVEIMLPKESATPHFLVTLPECSFGNVTPFFRAHEYIVFSDMFVLLFFLTIDGVRTQVAN